MRRPNYKKYLFLGLILLSLLTIPALFIQKTRSLFFSCFGPFFDFIATNGSQKEIEKGRLESENQLLRSEIGKLHAVIEQNSLLLSLQKALTSVSNDPKRYQENCFLLGLFVQSVPAKVIYRDPALWTSSLWINVGQKNNENLRMPVICKNSPVLVGRALVGIVDYVGEKQSRVRLITDSGLNPAVRAVRGLPQNALLIENIDTLIRSLTFREDMGLASPEKQDLLKNLQSLKRHLLQSLKGWHLAKGILQGSSQPLWRNLGKNLKGIGFNYDFPDEEGLQRDLLSGKGIHAGVHPLDSPLLKINDLLVTTGMDGMFPAGLPVAEITKIYPLREGSYTYEIEARPVVANINELHYLYVIPPMGFEERGRI